MLTMWLMLLVRSSSVQAFRSSPSYLFWREISWPHCNDYVLTLHGGAPQFATARRRYAPSICRNSMTNGLAMENIYTEWTLSQDKLLWENRSESLSHLAALLGRGLRGTEQRLAKLKDVNNAAYQRLFAENFFIKSQTDDANEANSKKKLVPSSEVLRRIQWDSMLSSEDFSVMHYDRVDDALVETPLDAPNRSITGKATKFIDALPEHRIVCIKYKERIVWDREKRLDCVFGDEGITDVIRGYDEWKKAKDEEEERNNQRRLYVTTTLQQMLGLDGFDQLNLLWDMLTSKASKDPTLSMKLEAEKYVRTALALFKDSEGRSTLQPPSDLASLELLSEYVVLYEESKVRSSVFDEIYLGMLKAEGKLTLPSPRDRKLPELNENDLTETFIRGTGPGGQKINKTSNRVCLVHEPTQLRVECQETRSLPQNRKIARKRLQEKLDEYFHGSQSKANLKAQKLSSKKAKAKYRSRARMQEKKGSTESDTDESDDE
jgi:uncharacterized protein (UPF0248 family)